MSLEIGVMFTATADLPGTLAELSALGLKHGQIAVPGQMEISNVAGSWSQAFRTAGFQIHTLFGVYEGESYADIETVRKTVGFIPSATRKVREERTLKLVNLAAALKVRGVATHIGCLPEDNQDPDYIAVLAMVRRIADTAARHGITFALETGQESADALLDFLFEVDRENVGVNFDPANMILYGMGDPVEALETVGQNVFTVHCKDGNPPAPSTPGSLGHEMPIGKGSVNFKAFLTMLRKIGYEKPLFIERETDDHAARLRDIARGKSYLERVIAEI
jgi:sugar phosphate isomerase/epimerase